MLAGFQEFKELSDGKRIKMMNNKFNEFVGRYNFNLIQSQIINDQQILRKINESAIIMLDSYFTTTYKFYIVCFENELIILNNSHQAFIKYLFSRKNEHKIYFVPKFNSIFRKNSRLCFFEEEVNSLKNELRISPIHGKVVRSFWEIIKPCISAYIIKKSHHSLIENRSKILNDISYFNRYLYNMIPKQETRSFYKDEFIILRIIKTTQSSTIKLCYHIKNEQLVIIKSFQRESSKLKSRELENYKKINFIYIPKFYGEIVDTNEDSIVIEFIEGPTLQSLNKIKLNRYQKFSIFNEIITTFGYLHQYNFIYRDLKPSNLIFVEPCNIFLIDFDQMISNDYLSFTNDFSSQFVSPELQQKNCKPSTKNDIYSIGKILYYIYKDDIENQNSNINKKLKAYIIAFCGCCMIEESELRPPITKLSLYFIKILLLINDKSLGEDLYLLGVYYEKKDIKKSIYYLTLAAEQANLNASNKLGFIYSTYRDVRDVSKANYYYTKAADAGHSEAQFKLGKIYYIGGFVDTNILKINFDDLIYNFSKNNNYIDSICSIYSNKCFTRDINKAIHYLTLSANQNNIDAIYFLGYIYLKSELHDIHKAIHYFTICAEYNDSRAHLVLGSIYSGGKYIKPDINKAINYLKLSTKDSICAPFAYYLLSKVYMKINIYDAINFLKNAADLNCSKARLDLGLMYYGGIYISQDINKSILYFTQAANQNNQEAQVLLGKIYYDGDYITHDINKSIYYLTKAANQNNQEAQFLLGKIYYDGNYITRDINKSIYYLTKAANQDSQEAQFLLGKIYYDGNYITRDINKSIYYLTKAANQNNQEAQVYLGIIYYDGEYIKRDVDMSIFYLTKAANLNNQFAQALLGKFYCDGKHIKRDINKSIYYLTLPSNQNNNLAQYYLGLIYYRGKYIKSDINKAIHYFKLSASQNNSNSQYYLGLIYYEGKYTKQNIYKSLKYLKFSAKNECRNAQLLLGDIYLEGKYVQANIIKSIKYYKSVSSFYNEFAKNNLGVIYKNGFNIVEKNFYISKIYFEEAIKEKIDSASMYNLANLLLDENLDECKKLLIKSSIRIFHSSVLFYLILIKEHGFVDLKLIKDEIKKYYPDWIELSKLILFISELYLKISKYDYDEIYQHFRKNDLVYINKHIYSLDEIKSMQEKSEIYKKDNAKNNINEDFYEGFGNDLYQH